MKYVRTKDGIYELQETKNGEEYLVRTNELIPLWNKDAYEIIKQSDDLEELLDMCFVKRQYDPMYKFGTLYECEYEIEVFKKKIKSNNPITAIYGLILTFDKTGAPTIKPAAKLNDKGGWELL